MSSCNGNGHDGQPEPTPLIQKPKFPVKPLNVIILMGGWSSEREVSLESGKGASEVLKAIGHSVTCVDPNPNVEEFVAQLRNAFPDKPADVIFNTLHGKWGEDGQVQGILETFGIPYTSSGILGSALAMNKEVSRQLALSAGVRIAPGQTMTIRKYKEEGYPHYPHVLKPIADGSSVDVNYIHDNQDAELYLSKIKTEDGLNSKILIETFIPGRDISVAVFNGEAMGVVESRRAKGILILSYESKYTAGELEYLLPAPLKPRIYEEVMNMAATMHTVLHCRGVSRSDFRYDDTNCKPGLLYYLETNSQPGITPTSIMPQIAGLRGWTYEDVLQWTLEDATLNR